jgi:polygalacturonase
MIRGSWLAAAGLACFGLAFPISTSAIAQTPPSGTPDDIVVAPPVIPDHKFNIVDFGGVGDGATINTDAFNKAIAAVTAAGGGHLEIPPGIFVTLPFQLTSHIDLHLDAGAKIMAPEKLTDWGYPDPATATKQQVSALPRPRGFISGSKLSDIAITGSGTIDGAGQYFWIWSDKAARRYPPGRLIYPRPRLVELRGCQRIHVDGVTLTNSPMENLVASSGCADVLIENVRVFAPSDSPNTDAIDPGGNRIIVRNCETDTGDDNIAIQSNSHNVLIEDITCLHGHGISIGSGTVGGVSHVFVRRCTFDGGENGIRIKSNRGRGGEVHDIHYSDITMKNVNRPFDINMLYNGNANTKTDIGPRQANGMTDNVPNFHDIHVTNLTSTRSPDAGRILGIPEELARDIIFTNVKIQADRGFTLQDAKDIIFDHVQLDIAVGEPITTDNASIDWRK